MARRLSKAEPFTLDHFESWAELLVLDSGDNNKLQGFQRHWVDDLFGGRQVNWLVLPEGNGKTTLLASLGLYGLRFAEDASIPIAASSRDQARIMYRQMKGFVMRSGLIEPESPSGVWFEPFDGYRRIDLRAPTGRTKRGISIGQIEIHAADAGTADGVIPFPYAFIDELHRHPDLSLHRTWAGKLDKRGAQLVAISTAGEPGHDFETTREKLKAECPDVTRDGAFGRYISDRVCLHDYQVQSDAVLDVVAVKDANPLKSITPEKLAAKLADPTMTERHWRRFTCNLATMDEGNEPFIDLEDWDGLAGGAEIADGASVCLGADGSRSWDTTVVAWASMDEDGMVDVDARVFSVREDIDCHVQHRGGKIDFDDVESFLIDRFDRFDVDGAAYDPRYLERSMDLVDARLPDAKVEPVEPSSKKMRDALQAMFNLAAEGKLRHRGDLVLRQHVANSGVDRGFGSEIRRIRKIDGRLPIDAVPAMAMAVWMASMRQHTIYRDRGLIVV